MQLTEDMPPTSIESPSERRRTLRAMVIENRFRAFSEFPENGLNAKVAFRNAIDFHRRILFFWSPKRAKYREREYLDKKFTSSTIDHIDNDSLILHLSRQRDLLEYAEKQIPISTFSEIEEDKYYTNIIYMMNLGYNLHHLDDDVVMESAIGKAWQKANAIHVATAVGKLKAAKDEYRSRFRDIAAKEIERGLKYNNPYKTATSLAKAIELDVIAAIPSTLRIKYSLNRIEELIREDFKLGVRKKVKS